MCCGQEPRARLTRWRRSSVERPRRRPFDRAARGAGRIQESARRGALQLPRTRDTRGSGRSCPRDAEPDREPDTERHHACLPLRRRRVPGLGQLGGLRSKAAIRRFVTVTLAGLCLHADSFLMSSVFSHGCATLKHYSQRPLHRDQSRCCMQRCQDQLDQQRPDPPRDAHRATGPPVHRLDRRSFTPRRTASACTTVRATWTPSRSPIDP